MDPLKVFQTGGDDWYLGSSKEAVLEIIKEELGQAEYEEYVNSYGGTDDLKELLFKDLVRLKFIDEDGEMGELPEGRENFSFAERCAWLALNGQLEPGMLATVNY